MKTLFFALCLLTGINVLGQTTVTGFNLPSINNENVSLDELKGENLTVIDFWATWCRPCISSIPKLQELYTEFKDSGVNFVGISIDSPRNTAKVKPMVKSLGVTYPVVLDTNSEVKSSWNVIVVPTLLVINDKNEVVYFHEGFKPGDENLIKSAIQELLAKE